MKAETRLFGEISIAEDKIIKLEQGIIGFPDLKNFALIFDVDQGKESPIMWLQSLEEGGFALPVLKPNDILPTYSPSVSEEFLSSLGELKESDLFILVTVTVPPVLEDLAVNLKAPIIINSDTNKGRQVIVEDDYDVKFKIYQLLQEAKAKAGE